MNTSTKNIHEYYIVFTSSKHNNWMVRWQSKPFQHVYAVKKSPGGHFWIKVDAAASHTNIDLLPVSEYPHVRMLTDEYDVILPVKAVIEARDRWTLCVFNCVEVVKSLLGIRAFWVFTPRQLYKYILKGA